MNYFLFLLLFTCLPCLSQNILSGKVTDPEGKPLEGVSIYLKHSYDGATSDTSGSFLFKTTRQGPDTIVAAMAGYLEYFQVLSRIRSKEELTILLREDASVLDAVVITAGSFEASDHARSATLKSLDIATTAGATADIAGALNTLPGTQKVGETGRLFVRGGDGSEARTFIDGLWVQNPYSSTIGNIPGRNRFSPFLFKGTTFSTGGYSAEYSQALSSALVLKTNDFPPDSKTDIGLMSVGGTITETSAMGKHALIAEASYFNLQPYFKLVPQNRSFMKAPESGQASVAYRFKTSGNTMLKSYVNYCYTRMGLFLTDPLKLITIQPNVLKNDYLYFNTSFSKGFSDKWSCFSGVSYNYMRDRNTIQEKNLTKLERGWHIKNSWKYQGSGKIQWRFGGEILESKVVFKDSVNRVATVKNINAAIFAEQDISLSKKISLRPGLRMDYVSFSQEWLLSPRISAALKTGQKSQLSAAFGQFIQSPAAEYCLTGRRPSVEKAIHYILSWQVMKQSRTFRAEVYEKEYQNLITYDQAIHQIDHVANAGHGYARGLDVFLRDKKTIKNADYWFSYSYLDTKRLYQQFRWMHPPSFASTHNFSLVYKHFFANIRTQLGATMSYGSPRSYYDPYGQSISSSYTAYRDLSFNAAFLYRENIIFYISATNLPGFKNIYGYRFSQVPDETGKFQREEISQASQRFLFAGIFITISSKPTENQLNNL